VLDGFPNSSHSYLREIRTLLTAFPFLARIVAKEKPDILHVHNPPDTMAVVASLVSSFFQIPLVYDINDPGPESIQSHLGLSRTLQALLMPIARLWEWIILRRVSGIVVVSEAVKVRFQQTRQQITRRSLPIVVMYNSTDTVPQDLEIPSDGREGSILYVGTLTTEFLGLDDLIRSFAEIAPHFKGQLRIIGDGPLKNRLKKLVNKLGLDRRVEIPGYMRPESVAQDIASAALCVIPYKRTVLTEMTVPTKLFEFMAFGKAIVRPAFRGLDEVLGEESPGRYDADDSKGMITALKLLLSDERLRKKAGIDNQRRFAAFPYRGEICKLVRLYEDILSAKSVEKMAL
jgi:glycosyltransferase involved in cell wall biosynthesis